MSSPSSTLDQLHILRLYFPAWRTRRPHNWLRKLSPEGLGIYLLRQAKEADLEQALLQRVLGGFLRGHNLQLNTGELAPAKLPMCLELIGNRESLDSYLRCNREHLDGVRVLFSVVEDATVEASEDMTCPPPSSHH